MYHNFHHLKNIGNFGSMFIMWDSIFGTNSYYYKEMDARKEKRISLLDAQEDNKAAKKNE